ncbi:MAG: hypothetical protein ACXVB9_19970 [Bdellovibrionota bacterium]
MLFAILLAQYALAAPNYVAERDPATPEAKKQFRLILRTPDRACDTWHKVEPKLDKADMLISSTKRDEPKGCRFVWVITPDQNPGPVRFELEGHTGPKESFEIPAPPNYQPPKVEDNSNSPFMHVPGIADENGTGPAMNAPKGHLTIPTPGTGK